MSFPSLSTVTRFSGTYAEDWSAIANEVKDLAGRCCIRCGHAHEVATGYVLTVHHLDGQKDNNRWWNLLALCQRCHLKIQARLIPERPWLFAHSAWFIPYVCGFYASHYGGQEITREEAMADPDRWLRMGQPWLFSGAVLS